MNEYELIYEALEDAVASGEIDIEFAEAVNDIAYDKYLDELDDEYEESAAVNKIYDKHKKQATEYY